MKYCRKADIIIGILQETNQISEYFISSWPYYFDSITWCVRKKQPIALWKNLFHLCSDPIVYAVHTTIAISFLSFVYFLQQFESARKYDWNTILMAITTMLLGFSSNYKAHLISNRILFIACIFGGIVFSTIVLAFFLRITINPIYESQIKSFREIVDGSYDLIGDYVALQHMIRKNEVQVL